MKATMRIVAPHLGHVSGSDAYTCRMGMDELTERLDGAHHAGHGVGPAAV